MILVFDLDDTLYDEIQFVKCGFYSVSEFLSNKINISKDVLFKRMIEILEKEGRGKVFNTILQENNILTKYNVRDSLSIYRNVKPNLSLFEDAKYCLEKYSSFSKYVVTDGNKMVQKNKIIALGLDKIMKKAIPTHIYGIKHAKPSPYAFFKIVNFEKVPPNQVIYFGDNPNKDFINLKKNGFITIRLMRGAYSKQVVSTEYDAEYNINNFYELDQLKIL